MTAERLRRLDDEVLGSALSGLDLRWDPAPDVTADVVGTIRAADRVPSLAAGRVGVVGRHRTVVLIAAAIALLALVAFAARAVIDIGAITVERIEELPPGSGEVFPGATSDQRATLEEARAALQGDPAFPAALGTPDRLWVQEADPSGTSATSAWVGAAWGPSEELPRIDGVPWGAVFLQLRGDVELITKQVGIAGDLQEVRVGGADGVWLDGPHDLLLDDDGTLERYAVHGNVLVWQGGDRTYRLETALPLDDALALAETVG